MFKIVIATVFAFTILAFGRTVTPASASLLPPPECAMDTGYGVSFVVQSPSMTRFLCAELTKFVSSGSDLPMVPTFYANGLPAAYGYVECQFSYYKDPSMLASVYNLDLTSASHKLALVGCTGIEGDGSDTYRVGHD